ncbi:hypothetical protein ACIBJD_21945 [Kitasatospora sp. NPDC050467]|uniref:hypothetical protein n=1 Tax=Kitasatospora sp. NPDC050467 TaxID=3364053 RepID=UPI0037AA15DF
MIAEFWSGVSERLAERTVALLVSPALAFWSIGACWFFVFRRSRFDASLDRVVHFSPTTQVVALVVFLMVALATEGLVKQLVPLALRMLQGFWPRPLAPLRSRLIRRQRARLAELEDRWQHLYPRVVERSAGPDEEDELLAVEHLLAALSSRPGRILPTRLGNVLRAGETGVHDKYGLDPVHCWPALWLLLPEQTRNEVAGARSALDTGTTWWLWALLLSVRSVASPWILLVAATGCVLAYLALLTSAARYAELVDATFVNHRGLLYDALGRPRPAAPQAEAALGRQLTTSIRRGPAEAATLPGPPPPPP